MLVPREGRTADDFNTLLIFFSLLLHEQTNNTFTIQYLDFLNKFKEAWDLQLNLYMVQYNFRDRFPKDSEINVKLIALEIGVLSPQKDGLPCEGLNGATSVLFVMAWGFITTYVWVWDQSLGRSRRNVSICTVCINGLFATVTSLWAIGK